MTSLTLHEDPISANCYKIRLTAALLGLPLERRTYSILQGETRTPEFLRDVSSYGRIPVLQVGPSTFLPESNAACWYLAETASSTPLSTGPCLSLIPQDSLARAETLRWMFFEQNQHEVNIATLRFWRRFIGHENLDAARCAQVEPKVLGGRQVLDCMNGHLEENAAHGWFVGGGITLADVVLFAYTHVAHEGGFDLDEWPAVREWCERVKRVDGFVPMD